jgi:hypothetical protein
LELLEDRRVPSTFTVTTTADDIDGGTLANPAGPDGTLSLREAITVANLSAGTDTIAFNIPGVGVQTIMPGTALPLITDPVVIDGTTEGTNVPGAAIELNGASAGTMTDGLHLYFRAGNSIIRSLAINRFAFYGIDLESTGNTVQGCFVGTNWGGTVGLGNGLGGIEIIDGSNNLIGGTHPGDGNVISGNTGAGIVILAGTVASNNMIQGNFIGTDVTGTVAIPNSNGIVLDGTDSIIGNSLSDTSPGARNVISGNNRDGVVITTLRAKNNVITGNYIGVDAAGNAALGNQMNGVELQGAAETFLGFTVPNVISGNGVGIMLDEGAQHNTVVNNYVGVGADGSIPIGNLGQGIVLRDIPGDINPVQANSIGGTSPGTGNIIAHNGKAGIAIFGMPVATNGQPNDDNSILGNSIFSNGTTSPTTEVGIDLVSTTTFPTDDGPTPNQPGGSTSGPNLMQNFPVLTQAADDRNNAGTIVTGTLNSAPNTSFRVEFFDNVSASQTGFGEGQRFVTFANVTTDASGNASFTANLTPTVPPGHFLTATATDPNGNTSEFSMAITVVRAGTDIVGRADELGQWWMAQSTGSGFGSRLWATWSTSVFWDNVVTGDFNGDGVTDIAGRADETGQWWLGVSSGSDFATLPGPVWSTSVTWDNVVVGDFNGDGKADIAGHVLESGQWWVSLSNGTSFTTQLWATWSTGVTWVDVMVGKFVAGTKDDIVARADELGDWWVGLPTGVTFTSQKWATWSTGVTWVDAHVADFNNDGLSDIVARADELGSWWVGLSNGSKFNTSLWDTWSTGVTWVDVQVGDFNGDGKADIVGRADELGTWWVGISNGTNFSTRQWATWSTSVTWDDVQVGDFNNDGMMDLAGRVDETGQWWVALSNGSLFNSQLWAVWSTAVSWVDVNAGKF